MKGGVQWVEVISARSAEKFLQNRMAKPVRAKKNPLQKQQQASNYEIRWSGG
jgi:hypothetical protein